MVSVETYAKAYIALYEGKKKIEEEMEAVKKLLLESEDFTEVIVGERKLSKTVKRSVALKSGLDQRKLVTDFPEAAKINVTELRKIPSAHEYLEMVETVGLSNTSATATAGEDDF